MKLKKPSSPSAGFTFTISALVISLTLLAMAQFVTEWRRSGQVSLSETSAAQSSNLQQRVSSDLSAMLGARASLSKTGASSAMASLYLSLPLKKEGAGLASLPQYSSSLSASLGAAGVEAALYSNLSGQNGTVILFTDNGTLVMGNQQLADSAVFNHPAGWLPSKINITLRSAKAASSVGQIQKQDAGGTPTVTYSIAFYDSTGRSFVRTASAQATHNATLEIDYSDGTRLLVGSQFSPSLAQNFTYVYYTKSPGAYLVLPFDGSSTLQDYSGNSLQFQLGGGVAAESPSPSSGCKSGVCYTFDGSNDYINATGFVLAQQAVSLPNGDFEIYHNDTVPG